MPVDRDVRLGDGRVVSTRIAGPADAPALMYFPGTPDSRLTVDVCAGLPVSTPVRIVAFDRPGYGGSDFVPFSFDSVARDCGHIMDAWDIERFAVLSQSGGGPFALASAAHLPDRVTGVGIASGPGSFTAVPGAVSELVETDQAALAMIGVDDAEAARLFAAGFDDLAALLEGDDGALLDGLRQMLPTDAAVIDRPEVGGPLAVALREGVRQGVLGAAWDNVAWVGPWLLDLGAVSQPTWLWYGEDDPLVPRGHGEWLSGQIPQAELVVRRGEGHLGLFTHWDECVAALAHTIP